VNLESLELVVRILGAAIGALAFAGVLVGAYLAGRRGTSQLFERVGRLERDVEHYKRLYCENVPDLWRQRDDHERRLATLEQRSAVTQSLKAGG
jgi:hypothetical protein